MEIQYFGHSCFRIIGKNISVVTDPFDSKTAGYKPLKLTADVVTISHDHYDHNNIQAIQGNPLIFDTPGEFEVKGNEFRGIKASHDEAEGKERGFVTLFVVEIDGITICHLGDLGTTLSSEQLDYLDGVDILMIPVGGTVTINAETAAKIVADIEPKIVIPMHYGTKEGKVGGGKLEGVEKFIHEMGASSEGKERLKITKNDLPAEPEVVVLKY